MSTNTNIQTTQVQPATVTTTTVASKQLVRNVTDLLTLQTKLGNKFASNADFLRKEADENKLDKKGANVLLQNAYTQAFTQMGTSDGLKGDELKAFIETKLKSSGPDRSKMIALAFPTDEKAAAELKKAQEQGIGINAQLEISRGNTTVAEIIAKRSEAKAGTPRTQGDGTSSTTTTTPQAEAAAAKAQGLSAEEKFGNQVAALIALGKALGLSADKQQELIADAYASQGEAGEGEASKSE